MRPMYRSLWGALACLVLVGGSNQRTGGAPVSKGLILTPLGNYEALCVDGTSEADCFDEGAVEIAAYDRSTRRAFLTFAEQPKIDIVDLADPASPVLIQALDLTPWGGGAHATSVAVHEGTVAAAVPQGEDDNEPGKVLFFDTNGTFVSEVTVGSLPDMITFTPNGRFLLTANEGQPSGDYLFDPEGSVSIIDMRGGAEAVTQAGVATADFSAFNAPAAIDPRIRIFGPGASVAQDLEPEYIAVSHDSKTAWVTLQENNALGIIDLRSKTVTALVALGFKDHSADGFGLDASTSPSGVSIQTWPVRGMYQPDAIAVFQHRGEAYLVTANEGDVREYDGLNAAGTEAMEVEDLALDPGAFPAGAELKAASRIGKLKVSAFDGDTDGDGDADELYAYGARSFSIWSSTGALVFDSGDDFEQITGAVFPANFNASNTNNTRDNRSDDKGPEPEGVTVATLFGREFIFVVLERIGGVMVYEVTDPARPAFAQYVNLRNVSAGPSTPGADDLGPEGVTVVEGAEGPILIVSNEVSGTLRTFRIGRPK